MEQHEIRLVEEDNTIYEIDMDCIRKNNWRQREPWKQMKREDLILKRTGQKKHDKVKSRGSSPRLFLMRLLFRDCPAVTGQYPRNREKSNFYQSLSSVFVLLLISRNRVRRIRTGAAG
ncbi:hypothetical protein LC724_01225 [Blautia sp. RD014234]|nr:hypothetical protein [Blautia parvula]